MTDPLKFIKHLESNFALAKNKVKKNSGVTDEVGELRAEVIRLWKELSEVKEENHRLTEQLGQTKAVQVKAPVQIAAPIIPQPLAVKVDKTEDDAEIRFGLLEFK